jgi:hypothetical protein
VDWISNAQSSSIIHDERVDIYQGQMVSAHIYIFVWKNKKGGVGQSKTTNKVFSLEVTQLFSIPRHVVLFKDQYLTGNHLILV